MSKQPVMWVGVLEAGKSSSPVLRDFDLPTGDPSTIYLFNLMRGAILEYRTTIVEAKLRDLTPDEASLAQELQEGYRRVRPEFKPRGKRRFSTSSRRRKDEPEPDLDSFDDDDSWPIVDDDGPGSDALETNP